MLKITVFLVILFCGPVVPLKNIHAVAPDSSHSYLGDSTWKTLLKKHVDNEGNVDYKNFMKDSSQLNSYLHELSKNKPEANSPKNERLAYYINLYNAATVKLILDNYPLKSIKNLKNPWDKKWISLGGEKFSLGEVENKILRKMNEPRIHFAINCASYSCPKLMNIAFLASNIDAQLEQAAKDFINDPKRNKISQKKAELSKVFKWYNKDFTENGSLVDYINKYSKTKISNSTKLSYLNYDWRLNETQ